MGKDDDLLDQQLRRAVGKTDRDSRTATRAGEGFGVTTEIADSKLWTAIKRLFGQSDETE